MKKNNIEELNYKLLAVFASLSETRSVTTTAEKMQHSQSSVSHMLRRLREILGDPLFVPSGRSLTTTPFADSLYPRICTLLENMRMLQPAAEFSPATLSQTVVIAANDLQRDLLLPAICTRLKSEAPGIRIQIIPSDVPALADFRDDTFELVLSPRVPDSSEIIQKKLFSDEYCIFYDKIKREPVKNEKDYLSAEHVSVSYPNGRMPEIDNYFADLHIRREIAIRVPGFAAILPFIRGSNRIATLPRKLALATLHSLATCPLPLPAPPMPMYLLWHRKYHHDSRHRWLRSIILECSINIMSDKST